MNAKEYYEINVIWNGTVIINTVQLMEDYHAYKSKPKGKTLEERKENFETKVHQFGILDNDFNYNQVNEFFEYWTEHGDNDKKMRFEKEKSFGIKRRLETWKKNSKKWDSNNKPTSLADKMKKQYGV